MILVLLFTTPCFAKKQDIPDAHFYYEQGLRYHKGKDLKNASLLFSNALRIDPNHLPSLIELACVFIELSRPDQAISYLLLASNIAPDDALIHILLGVAYEENKQLKQAISQFKIGIKLEPENTLIRENLGLACFKADDYKCAIDNLGNVVLVYPLELRSRAALGAAYHSSKNYNLAKEQYKFVIDYEPNNVLLWYNLAKSQLALNEYVDAIKSIDMAILIDDSIVDLYLDRANINYKLNMLQEADNDYLKAINIDPLNPEIPIEYGSFLWKTNSHLKAVEQFDNALKLKVDDKELLAKKAYLLQLAEKDTDAIKAWQEVLEKDADDLIALYNLAKLYQKNKDYENAVIFYKKLIQLKDDQHENDLEAKSNLAFCFHKSSNLEDAKIVYEDIINTKIDDSITLYNFGILLNEQKKYDQASIYLEKAIKHQFQPAGKAYQALVEAYSSLNDFSNLKLTYKNWLELDKNNTIARINYAKFLVSIGDSNSALEQYRLAAALDTTSRSRYQLAQFLIQQKDLYGAIGQLQEYLKIEPNDLNALISLANTFKDLGIEEQAINSYKKIISIQPDNYLAHYNFALLYVQQKKYEQAQNLLLKAVELNDKFAPAYYALGLIYISSTYADREKKAKESFEKYLLLEPNGEYKGKVETKLKELNDVTKSIETKA